MKKQNYDSIIRILSVSAGGINQASRKMVDMGVNAEEVYAETFIIHGRIIDLMRELAANNTGKEKL